MLNTEKPSNESTPHADSSDSTTCLTCTHWMLKKSSDKDIKKMARMGFARCALGPPWAYLPPLQTCDKHKPVAADVAAARIEWNAKG